MTSTTLSAPWATATSPFLPVLQKHPPRMIDSEMRIEPERPAFEATSSIRQDSAQPQPPSVHKPDALFHRRPRDPVEDDVYRLPPPDLSPRFLFRSDVLQAEDTSPLLTNSVSLDPAPPIQTPIYRSSSPPPRIYFGPSPITFVPPVSYDFLERDPRVKGAPRNYRAWSRAGRPKLEVEGAERSDAKSDFRAMGLVFPPGSDSEDGGDETGDSEKRKKKRKKKQLARTLVPIDRPRRTLKKLVEIASPATPPLQMKLVNEKEKVEDKGKEVKPKSAVLLQAVDKLKKEPISKSTNESVSSGRRSSSTLLDTDVVESSKRRHDNSEKEDHGAPPVKKVRMSKRLHARTNGVQDDTVSSHMASDQEQSKDYSPLTDLPPSPAGLAIPNPVEVKLKRRRSPSPAPRFASKKRPAPAQQSKVPVAGSSRAAPTSASRPGHRLSRDTSAHSPPTVPTRTFPASLPIIPGYSSFYRRYPLITQFHQDDPVGKHVNPTDTQPKRSIGNWNPPRDHRDLYTPRYTRGSGGKKIALCPICFEDPARGGEGRQEWNHTKTSQHNYHMQYYHGISATRCAPFSPPVAQRVSPVSRPQTNEKSEILQGKCHVCKQWVALEGCKIGELKVKELLWWKHAAQCHKDSKLAGEDDIFIEDDPYRRLKEYEVTHPPEAS